MTPEEIAKSIALYDETQGNETQKSISQNTDWTTKIGERGIEVVCLVLDAKKSSKTQAGSTELEIYINDLDDVEVDPVVGEKTDDGILLNVKNTTIITEHIVGEKNFYLLVLVFVFLLEIKVIVQIIVMLHVH